MQQDRGWLLPPSLGRSSAGAPLRCCCPPASLPHLLGGPELHLFMLPRIPQPVNSQPRACQGKNNVFQPRCSTGFHTTHSAAKAKLGPFLNIPPHLQSGKLRCCTAQPAWNDGCLFWQGNRSLAHAIFLVDSQDQCCDPSALGVLLHKEPGLLKSLARTGSAVTGFAVIPKPAEPSP